ncbi:MAG: transglycosylase SLT domain-containing protein [Deltaproteobacteria bacterium]|nr:transglycosylase SLT domain-containing protein [Deltaproteobacteria bacterium]
MTDTTSSIGKLSGSLEDYFVSASKATGVSVDLLKAVAKVESSFNQAARSPAGAIGTMQLMPSTARGLGVDPYDLGQNVLGGAKYLQQALNAFSGNIQLALAAYNAGIGAVQRAIQKAGSETWKNVEKYLPKETQAYVPRVMSNMGNISVAVAGESKVTDELQKEYDRRRQIQEQYADATTSMYQDIYKAEADWWRSQKEISDSTISDLEYVRAIRQQQLDSLRNEIEYLTRDGASQEELNRAYALNAQYIGVLNEKKVELLNKIRTEQEFIAAVKREQAGLNTSTKEGTYQYALYNKAIADASQGIVELNGEMIQLNRTMNEAVNMPYQRYFNDLTAWMQHMENIGQLTVEQQLKILEGIDLQKLALQDQWRVQEDIYRRRQQALQEEMEAIREAYNDRMRQIEDEIEAEEEATQAKIEQKEAQIQAIEDETNVQIKAIQTLIDALDEENKQSDREEAERQHNKKLADLQEEYQYHAIRTGTEHQRRMDEILEEIAEEEHDWELQKQEWARQDQKDAYQQQIDALREQGKARQDAIRQEINDIKEASDHKKKDLQNYYDEIQRTFNDTHLNMLSSLSMYEDRYYEAVKRIMDKIRQAIEEGNIGLIPGLLEEAEKTVGEAEEAESQQPKEIIPEPPAEPVATFGPSECINKNGRTYAWARAIGQKLGLPVDWNAERGLVTIGGKSFRRLCPGIGYRRTASG